MAEAGKQSTGTPDPTYNLVSVMYHALEGASTVDQYIADAKQAGDKELASYLNRVKQSYKRLADGARPLLAARLKK